MEAPFSLLPPSKAGGVGLEAAGAGGAPAPPAFRFALLDKKSGSTELEGLPSSPYNAWRGWRRGAGRAGGGAGASRPRALQLSFLITPTFKPNAKPLQPFRLFCVRFEGGRDKKFGSPASP